MGARKVRTAVRQEQIAGAALRIVEREGLRGLSVAAVAREVGIVPSAIYRHYRSKDDVIDAVLALVESRLQGNAKAVCQETGDPLERLHRLLARHIALIRESRALLRVVISEGITEGRPQRRTKVYGMLRNYLARIADILRQGQGEGKVRADVPPEALSVMFMGIIQAPAILWMQSDGAFDAAAQAETGWRLFHEAIYRHGETPR